MLSDIKFSLSVFSDDLQVKEQLTMKRIINIYLLLFCSTTYAQYKTEIHVAPDGTGDFATIQEAIDGTKSFPDTRITIYIKNGVYEEKVKVHAWNSRLTLKGESAEGVIIRWDDYFKKIDRGRNSTFHTATMLVQGDDFRAENLTIENTAGPVGQAVALAVEPGEKNIMKRPPVDPSVGIFTRQMVFQIVWVGALLGVLCLGMGYNLWAAGDPSWRTLIFSTLTFGQMANVLAVRTGKESLFRAGIMSNRPLLIAVLLTCVLQLAVIYVPFLQTVFKTVPLSAGQLGMCLAFSSLIFWALETEKLVLKLFNPAPGEISQLSKDL